MTTNNILAKMRAKQPKPPPRQEQQKKPKPKPPKFRLPHASMIVATYDTATEKWSVILTLPGGKTYHEEQPSLEYATRKVGQRWFKESKGA